MKKYSLVMQFILLILLICFLISSFITNNYSYTYIIMGLLLLVMSYNNKVFYKRKYMTFIYLIVGIYVIGLGVFNAIGN